VRGHAGGEDPTSGDALLVESELVGGVTDALTVIESGVGFGGVDEADGVAVTPEFGVRIAVNGSTIVEKDLTRT